MTDPEDASLSDFICVVENDVTTVPVKKPRVGRVLKAEAVNLKHVRTNIRKVRRQLVNERLLEAAEGCVVQDADDASHGPRYVKRDLHRVRVNAVAAEAARSVPVPDAILR